MSKLPNKRPFLVVTFSRKPVKGSNTSVKGWAETGEWDVNENMLIVDRLSKRHLEESHVILDLFAHRITKNRFSDLDNTEVFATYSDRYHDEIKNALMRWVTKNPANFEVLKSYSSMFNVKEAFQEATTEISAEEVSAIVDAEFVEVDVPQAAEVVTVE